MKATETITAYGTGYWGMPVNIALMKVTYEFTHRWSREVVSVTRYEIQFSTEAGVASRRVFPLESERGSFLKSYFSDLQLTQQLSENTSTERKYCLSSVL